MKGKLGYGDVEVLDRSGEYRVYDGYCLVGVGLSEGDVGLEDADTERLARAVPPLLRNLAALERRVQDLEDRLSEEKG